MKNATNTILAPLLSREAAMVVASKSQEIALIICGAPIVILGVVLMGGFVFHFFKTIVQEPLELIGGLVAINAVTVLISAIIFPKFEIALIVGLIVGGLLWIAMVVEYMD